MQIAPRAQYQKFLKTVYFLGSVNSIVILIHNNKYFVVNKYINAELCYNQY